MTARGRGLARERGGPMAEPRAVRAPSRTRLRHAPGQARGRGAGRSRRSRRCAAPLHTHVAHSVDGGGGDELAGDAEGGRGAARARARRATTGEARRCFDNATCLPRRDRGCARLLSHQEKQDGKTVVRPGDRRPVASISVQCVSVRCIRSSHRPLRARGSRPSMRHRPLLRHRHCYTLR